MDEERKTSTGASPITKHDGTTFLHSVFTFLTFKCSLIIMISVVYHSMSTQKQAVYFYFTRSNKITDIATLTPVDI